MHHLSVGMPLRNQLYYRIVDGVEHENGIRVVEQWVHRESLH